MIEENIRHQCPAPNLNTHIHVHHMHIGTHMHYTHKHIKSKNKWVKESTQCLKQGYDNHVVPLKDRDVTISV